MLESLLAEVMVCLRYWLNVNDKREIYMFAFYKLAKSGEINARAFRGTY